MWIWTSTRLYYLKGILAKLIFKFQRLKYPLH